METRQWIELDLMRMERSGDDCNCDTLTRDDASDIGLI